MVSEKIIMVLLIVAVLLSVVSIAMTVSLSTNIQKNNYQGRNNGEERLIVNPKPEAGTESNTQEIG